MNEMPLFSWLHISDLHIKDEHTLELQITQLIEDLLLLKEGWYENEFGEKYGPPVPQFVFVTGDLANTGDAHGTGEYAGAEKFLEKICNDLHIDKKSVFIVPGNHDVHREVIRGFQLELISNKPTESDHQTSLRFNNYRKLFEKFAEVDFSTKDLSWYKEVGKIGKIPITIVGLNTALTSATKSHSIDHNVRFNDDYELLQLHPSFIDQLKNRSIIGQDKLNIILMHHPVSWLQSFFSLTGNTIIFHGHTHKPNITRIESSTGLETLTIIAGAVRLGEGTSSSLEQHGYNIGAIYSDHEAYRIEVWPRVFFGKDSSQGRYYLDVFNVPPGRCYKSINWPKKDLSNPRTQHKLFWKSALRNPVKDDGKIKIWIAAHSAWYTFRPKVNSSKKWDEILFIRVQLQLEDLEGDVWEPLIQIMKSNSESKIELFILLAHPYGVEAQCVLRNQLIEEEEKTRHAQKDFFRTLRSLQLIQNSDYVKKGAIKFDIRVLNPCFRIMTYSMYAVGKHILFVPLHYSILVDKGFAVGQIKDSRYGGFLESIKKYFSSDSEYIKDSHGKLYFGARQIDLECLPDDATTIEGFMHAVENKDDFSWLRTTATYDNMDYYLIEEGTFHSSWMHL